MFQVITVNVLIVYLHFPVVSIRSYIWFNIDIYCLFQSNVKWLRGILLESQSRKNLKFTWFAYSFHFINTLQFNSITTNTSLSNKYAFDRILTFFPGCHLSRQLLLLWFSSLKWYIIASPCKHVFDFFNFEGFGTYIFHGAAAETM